MEKVIQHWEHSLEARYLQKVEITKAIAVFTEMTHLLECDITEGDDTIRVVHLGHADSHVKGNMLVGILVQYLARKGPKSAQLKPRYTQRKFTTVGDLSELLVNRTWGGNCIIDVYLYLDDELIYTVPFPSKMY